MFGPGRLENSFRERGRERVRRHLILRAVYEAKEMIVPISSPLIHTRHINHNKVSNELHVHNCSGIKNLSN